MFENKSRNQNKRGWERFNRSLSYHNEYVSRYNKNSNKLLALSSLSQIRVELNRIIESVEVEIDELTQSIVSFVTVDENEEWEIRKQSKIVLISINHTFPYTGYSSNYEVSKKDLISYIEEFCNAKDKLFRVNIRNDIERAYKGKQRLEDLLIHIEAIESLIDKILDENFPGQLDKFSEKEVRSKNQGGRPKVIPDDILETEVLDILNKAEGEIEGFEKVIHSTPKRKGNPNYSAIARKLYSLGIIEEDEIGIKALRDKVSHIVKENWN